MMKNITIFGKGLIDENSIRQIENCISDDGDIAVLTADAHYGYGHPIGGAVAYQNKISLSGVGFDIACGNMAVRTEVNADEIDVPRIMDEIFRRISFGVGRNNDEAVDHPVLEKIDKADFRPQRILFQLAANQLGTVGAGNHFVDLFTDEEGKLWVGVHFGSRGFGHRTTMGFIAMSQGKQFNDKAHEGPMDAPPILFDSVSEIANDYLGAMMLAGEYANAGRELVVAKVLEILGNPAVTFQVHNHHNFAWHEEHFGKKYWVVRKGCTPAFPGQRGFIGATMAEQSVIIEGVDGEVSKKALYSTVHGAGRSMSRTKAAGKTRWKRNASGVRVKESISKGEVDFATVIKTMKEKKIVLRGSAADEAPQCYKRLDEVLSYQAETIRILHRLSPIGVAMAGDDVYDPYKD